MDSNSHLEVRPWRCSPWIAPLLCLASGCTPSAPDALPPNVVLLVLDTVRADHLSSYGYERNTTSHVDAFAAQATRYTECRSTGPWTLPSHASMFTVRLRLSTSRG